MNRLIQRVAACFTVVCLLAGLSACGSSSDDGSSVLAQVEDRKITEQELEEFSAISMQMMGYDAGAITEEQREQFLNELVEIQVVRTYFEQNGQDVYGDEFEESAQSFVDSAHESALDFLDKYNISDEALKEYYGGQFAVSALFMEIQSRYAQEDLYSLAKEYYEEHRTEFVNSDGSYEDLDDVIQPVYYALYSEFYRERVDELKEDMEIEIR